MVSPTHPKFADSAKVLLAGSVIVLAYGAFLQALWKAWGENPEFSFGILIPFLVAYLVWSRRAHLVVNSESTGATGLVLVVIGCCLHILGTFSGTMLLSGVALVITVWGAVRYLWGPACLKVTAAPLALLMLMVPLPAYALGQLSWWLQGFASSISTVILRFLGTPVLQEGNLLRLPNYMLEVQQACSGSRSLFALVALSLVLGLSTTQSRWIRLLLVGASPVFALGANIVRIVGTGLIARQWGAIAADESLHFIWGILVFLIAVFSLLGFQRFLQWATNAYA